MDEKAEKKLIKDARKLEQVRELNRNKFISQALVTQEGRDFFYWLLTLTKMGQNPFSTDVMIMAFQSGEMNVGLQVQALVMSEAPEAYLRMLRERAEEEVNGRRAPDDDNDNGTESA